MKPTATDRFLQGHTPVVAVPKFGEFEALGEPGHRFLIAADGLWLEVRRPWMHLITPLAQQASVAMPMGSLAESIRFAFLGIPVEGIRAFIDQSRQAFPNEVGAVMVWSPTEQVPELRATETLHSGVGVLRERWPALASGESIVVDLHTHGPIEAYFSDEDRRDTGGEVMLAGVVGGLQSVDEELILSLFACGVEVKLLRMRVADIPETGTIKIPRVRFDR